MNKNNYFAMRHRKILLLIDNCPSGETLLSDERIAYSLSVQMNTFLLLSGNLQF